MQSQKSKFKYQIFIGLIISVVFFGGTKVFASDITEENIVYLINQERTYYGLAPLQINQKLETAAKNKTKDMLNKNYFEHYAYGMSPWGFIKNQNYNYLNAGENLAMNFDTAEGMVNAWMNSESHKKNILSSNYNEMGIGISTGQYTESGETYTTTIVSNMFGKQKPVVVEAIDKFINNFSIVFKK